MKIFSQELDGGVTVTYRKDGVEIFQKEESVILTDAQLKIIRDTIRENAKASEKGEGKP